MTFSCFKIIEVIFLACLKQIITIFVFHLAYQFPVSMKKENIVEVMVEDMGNIGGIYEGPIGITTRTLYERYIR